jgi:hypothetical protein
MRAESHRTHANTKQEEKNEPRDTEKRNKQRHERVPLEPNLHELGGQNRHGLGARAKHTKSEPEKRGDTSNFTLTQCGSDEPLPT